MKKVNKFTAVLLCVALLLTLSVNAATETSTPTWPEPIVQTDDGDIISPLAQTSTITDNGVYRIKNVGSGKYLNLHYGIDANATNVYQWTYDGSTEQKWRVSYHLATDSYQIYSMSSSGGKNRLLDVSRGGASLTSGQNVAIWDPVDELSHQMDIMPVGNSQYKITMKGNSNLCLTAYGTANGTADGKSSTSAGNVFISTYTGAANQKWNFEYTDTKVVVAPVGWLDAVTDERIRGWIWRRDLPNTPTTVYFALVNNDTGYEYNFTTIANLYRDDLLSAGYGNGYHGFNYAIDWTNYPPGNYTVNVYGAEGAIYYLSDSPKTYKNEIDNLYMNLIDEGVSYVYPLDGGVIAGIGFRITCNAFVNTTTLTNRIATKVTTFASTEPNPNPEVNSPDITVGTTTLNGTNIPMVIDRNIMVPLTSVWDNKVGTPNMVVGENSVYSSTVSVMLQGAIYPLQTVVNSFSF